MLRGPGDGNPSLPRSCSQEAGDPPRTQCTEDRTRRALRVNSKSESVKDCPQKSKRSSMREI